MTAGVRLFGFAQILDESILLSRTRNIFIYVEKYYEEEKQMLQMILITYIMKLKITN